MQYRLALPRGGTVSLGSLNPHLSYAIRRPLATLGRRHAWGSGADFPAFAQNGFPNVAFASRHGFRLVSRLRRAAVDHRPTQDHRCPRELLPPRVVAKLIVIVEIFVAASDAEDALSEHGASAVHRAWPAHPPTAWPRAAVSCRCRGTPWACHPPDRTAARSGARPAGPVRR